MRRHFKAHIAVIAAGRVINRTQHVGGHLNILDRQRLVKFADLTLGILGEHLAQRVIVVGAARDRFFENGRIAGNPADAVLIDQPFEAAARKQIAPDIIQPDRLTLLAQLFQRVHGPLPQVSCRSAAPAP